MAKIKLIIRYAVKNECSYILPLEYESAEKLKEYFEKTVRSSARNGKVSKKKPGSFIDGSFILLGREFNCCDFLQTGGLYLGPEISELEKWFEDNKLGKNRNSST